MDLALLKKIIERKSLTPNDEGIQKIIYEDLLSFIKTNNLDIKISKKKVFSYQTTNHLITLEQNFSSHQLKKKEQEKEVTLGFLGHTDVVPANKTEWKHFPFKLSEQGEYLFGRGLVDMKGAIYCFIQAVKKILYANHHQILPKILIFLTSDEEGSGQGGICTLLDTIKIPSLDFLIIGEPTSTNFIGDYIKNGRRGSIHGLLTLLGEQYHVAYKGKKEIFSDLEKILNIFQSIQFQEDKESTFKKTSLEITNIESEKTVENVIPGSISLRFNIRNTPSYPLEKIKEMLAIEFKKIQFTTEIKWAWKQGGIPWLSNFHQNDIELLLPNHLFKTTTSGGLSDGWKFHTKGFKNIFELGLKNQTAHQKNESCTKEDLKKLSELYLSILQNAFCVSDDKIQEFQK